MLLIPKRLNLSLFSIGLILLIITLASMPTTFYTLY